MDLPLRCSCGAVRGLALDVSPESGNRVVCYCDDCQAFGRFIEQKTSGKSTILDARGGTDVYQMPPARLRITEGNEQLRCLRLSEKGLFRWYTACCGTAVGNTLDPARSPFVGLIHQVVDFTAIDRPRDEILGPRRGIQGRFAIGGCPPDVHPTAPLGLIARSVGLLGRWWLAGKHTPSPFFDARANRPVAVAEVLTAAERERLRGPARAS